ncbi:U3 small nucleolar ribonucleoprotein complex, subunit Mpp10 [Haematococcus lacustris]
MAGSDEEEAGDGAGEAGEEEGEEELQLRRMLSRTAKAAGRPKPQGAPFMYSDFFGQQLPQAPTAAPTKKAVGSLGHSLAGSGAEGSAGDALGEEEQSEEEEEEEGEEAEEEDEQQQRGANGSTAGRKALGIAKAVPGARGKPEQLSTHEQRLLRMQERIGELEAAALGEKQWTLLGEVDAQRRPLNSVLEVDLDFDTTVRPAPEPSQEAMASLEDLIKQRIADHKFDDVVRVLPLGPEPQRKELLLQDTKAAKGLGEEYEEAYVKAAGGTTQVQDAEDKLRQAARLLFQELVAKLDALSHFHYTPKPVVEDLSVRTDVAAVRMEEAAPLAVSTASMQVPAEVYKPTEGGAPKAEAELTKEDRKRRRAAHKRAGKSAALQQQSEKRAKALASGTALPAPDNGLPVAGRKSAALAAATGGKKGAKRAAKEAAAAAGVGATKHARTEFGKSSKVFARIQEQQDQAKAGAGVKAGSKVTAMPGLASAFFKL